MSSIQVYQQATAEGVKKRKTRASGKSVNLVRQPDKEGIQRMMDPSYEQKLGALESQFQ